MREQDAIIHALQHGCDWHGNLLSPACAECGMVRFYRKNPDECRLRDVPDAIIDAYTAA